MKEVRLSVPPARILLLSGSGAGLFDSPLPCLFFSPLHEGFGDPTVLFIESVLSPLFSFLPKLLFRSESTVPDP